MIFLGIDPGLSGAVALWTPERKALDVFDMPTLKLKPNSDKRTLDVIELARLLDGVCKWSVTLAVIEQAGPRPNDGIRAAFGAGANWGSTYGALAAQFVPIDIIAPHVWKTAMRVTAAKDSSLDMVKKTLPQHAHFFARKKDEGRAEATLIALYAERRFRNRAVTP